MTTVYLILSYDVKTREGSLTIRNTLDYPERMNLYEQGIILDQEYDSTFEGARNKLTKRIIENLKAFPSCDHRGKYYYIAGAKTSHENGLLLLNKGDTFKHLIYNEDNDYRNLSEKDKKSLRETKYCYLTLICDHKKKEYRLGFFSEYHLSKTELNLDNYDIVLASNTSSDRTYGSSRKELTDKLVSKGYLDLEIENIAFV